MLYLDDAGFIDSRSDKHFVLAGIAVFERQVFRLQNSLERLTASLGHPVPELLEIHGNAILNGRGWWRRTPRQERRAIITDGLRSVQGLARSQRRLFGVVVDKEEVFPEDPLEYAFSQIAGRFNLFLERRRHRNDRQMGLVVMDDASYEARLQSFAARLRSIGHERGAMTNLVDVPFFVDSKATRGIQYADLVAYALFRKYERGDSEFFDVIADWFDSEGGAVHGLHHYRSREDICDCPSCISRPNQSR